MSTVNNQELCYKWWVKMMPMWKKWVRNTYLCGYEKEDLVQQSYIELVKCMEKFDPALGVPFESYYKMHLYQWRSNQNRKKREVLSITEEYEKKLMEMEDVETDIVKEVENKLILEEILKELDKLGDIEKQIITKYYLERVSLKEIASLMNMKYKTLEFKKGRILSKVRKEMQRYRD